MAKIVLTVNGMRREVDADGEMPLLWLLRDHLGLTGTKYGCGLGICGACTVHLDGAAVRSCMIPAAAASGREVRTIEGLSPDGSHPVQRAWIEEDVSQCGFCQAGQVMTVASLLSRRPHPTGEEVADALSGNLCRCGTYPRIRRAVQRAIELHGGER
jgi:aerobic-type carbon monoxide dehydrogenase small subunit (CoxS/CutS family)